MIILLGAQTQLFERVLSIRLLLSDHFNSGAEPCTANRVEIRHQLHVDRCKFHCHSCGFLSSTVSVRSTPRETRTKRFRDRKSIFYNNVVEFDFALLSQANKPRIIPRLPSLYQWYSGNFFLVIEWEEHVILESYAAQAHCGPKRRPPQARDTVSKGSFLIVDLQVSANISKQMTSSVDLQQRLRAFVSWLMKSLSTNAESCLRFLEKNSPCFRKHAMISA